MAPRLVALDAFLANADAAEAERTLQSDTEKRAFDAARALCRRLIALLTGKYDNVALLEAWGIEVVGTGTRIHTRVPKSRQDTIHMLDRYLAREASLPADQRVTTPSLAEVTTARDALVTASTQRVSAVAARELAINQRNTALRELLRLLQLIALHHIAVDYSGVIDQRLQTLGFRLVARSVRTSNEGGSEENPATP